MKPTIFEQGDNLYIVTNLAPMTPGQNEIDEFAFAEQLKRMAPNEHLMWLRGNYVEADAPNRNGQTWTAGELSIKKLTPMFMPVTVMHDPRTAVGLIADTSLKVPETDQVPRARIDTALALWGHRFPEVVEEVSHNYEQGLLMQSMECRAPEYTCVECGQTFPKLPQAAERANWCAHMKATDGMGARILGNVVFTGTGLIFGTRGAEGAYDEAHLEVFQEEVAEFHHKAKRDTTTKRPRRKHTMEIEDSRYEALVAKANKADELQAKADKVDEAETAKAQADKDLEAAEAAQKKAEDERDAAKKEVEDANTEKAKVELREERIGNLGKGFIGKLGEKTRERVTEQASTMSEEDWEARLTELEELTESKRDDGAEEGDPEEKAGKKGKEGETVFSREETARAAVGSGSGGNDDEGAEPSPEERASVMRGLIPAPSTEKQTA